MPRFRTGTYQDDEGYIRISAGPQRNKRVHQLIAEAKLGRKLKKDEVVHHVDGNKLNLDPANIQVLGQRDHNAVSAKQYWMLKKLGLLEKAHWDAYFEGTPEPRGEEDDAPF